MDRDNVPKGLQIVGLVAAVLLTAIFVEHGGTLDGGFRLFLLSLPTCAIGLVIYKLIARHEFEKPASWPEWILLYVIGMLIGGPLVALAVFIFKRLL